MFGNFNQSCDLVSILRIFGPLQIKIFKVKSQQQLPQVALYCKDKDPTVTGTNLRQNQARGREGDMTRHSILKYVGIVSCPCCKTNMFSHCL